jgi:CRP-like cAMP-binding protein
MATKKGKAPKKKVAKKAAKKKVAKKPKAQKRAPVDDGAVERSVQTALRKGPKSNKQLREETGTEDKKLTRTLQRLRRRGVLRVVKGRWALTSVKICPKCGGKGWIKQ